MAYIPFIKLEEETLSRMKEAENFLPYIYTFFNFADHENNISCAVKPLSARGENYMMSNVQEEIIDSSLSVLGAFADYYGDGEFEKYISSSFNYYLEKYNAGSHIAVSLSGDQSFPARARAIVRSMADLLYNYASFKKGKDEKVSRSIDSLISIESYFPCKYYVPVGGKLEEEYRLLFSKEMKIRRKSSFYAPHNEAIITKNKLSRSDITTGGILDRLFDCALVEENAKGFLALTQKSELLSIINTYGVIYFRDIKKKGLEGTLSILRQEGAVEESGLFLSPDERALMNYVLGSGYENSLSLFSYYTSEKSVDEEKAESDYPLLLIIMTALMLKVMEEISLIPQTVVKSLKNSRSR